MKFDYYEKGTIFADVPYSQFDENLRNAIVNRRGPNGQPLNPKRGRNVFATWLLVVTLIVEILWFFLTIVIISGLDYWEVILVANAVRGLINGAVLLVLLLVHCLSPKSFIKVNAMCIGYLFIRNGVTIMLSVSPVFKYVINGQEYVAVENTDRRRRAILPDINSMEEIRVSPKNPENIRWRTNPYETGLIVSSLLTAVLLWGISMLMSICVFMS